MRIVRVSQTDSTMNLLKTAPYSEWEEDLVVIVADNQTQGRGQRGNSWESEPGANLTFSIRLRPTWLGASKQFLLSEVTALAITETLAALLHSDTELSVKWPNDIYWRDKKICGILIEHRLSGQRISESIVGVGLNINQQRFVSDAPNPISLAQISGKRYNLETVLQYFLDHFIILLARLRQNESEQIHTMYVGRLYHSDGFYTFRDNIQNQTIDARIADIAGDGQLTLRLTNGECRSYYFKEVTFCI